MACKHCKDKEEEIRELKVEQKYLMTDNVALRKGNSAQHTRITIMKLRLLEAQGVVQDIEPLLAMVKKRKE